MAGFVRRFTSFPSLQVLQEIEGVDIVDLVPPGVFFGVNTGVVAVVGEFSKGPFEPTEITGEQDIENQFGGFSLSLRDPLSPSTNPYSNGAAVAALDSKSFSRLVFQRVDLTLVDGVNLQLVDSGGGNLANPITIPAGTRVRASGAPTEEFALAFDVTIAAGTAVGAGETSSTAFAQDTATYSTSIVSGVPVYSVQGNDETAVGDVDAADSNDLFRAGIGAGTANPDLSVTVSTGALGTAGANSNPLVALTSGEIDTAYENAIDRLLPGEAATDNIGIVVSARQSDAIRTKLREHVADASGEGRGRVTCIRPPIGTDLTTATGASAPGVGATRSDRVFYAYPHFEQRISALAELDPNETISSPNILIGADFALASILSNINPEANPGQSTQNIVPGGLLSYIRRLEPGLQTAGQPTKFTLQNYITFRSSGITALRRDADLAEFVFQSGVTSIDPSSFPARRDISRRRMADFIQDSLATIAKRYNKLPRTTERVDSLTGELTDFLVTLQSPNNPAAQRIGPFRIDTTSANNLDLQAAGIFVVITEVQLLGTLDKIVLQTTIGANVDVVSES